MPESWSSRKKDAKDGTPHQQTPDLDNLLKGLCDAVRADDERVWRLGSLRKIWGRRGRIEIS
jgi:Holliday junction resolvase RusA-like endonuclease